MGKNSKISWTDHTFNPWWGCTKVSTGCKHCYAKTWAERCGHTNLWGDNADRRFFGDKHWNEPAKWNRKAPGKVFSGSMCDLLEARPDLIEPRQQLYSLIDETPNLTWLLLTKRGENLARFAPHQYADGPGFDTNVWPGITAEDQELLMLRLPQLMVLSSGQSFVSVEPMIGRMSLLYASLTLYSLTLADLHNQHPLWVIIGGESGNKARLFYIKSAIELVLECQEAGVPVFVKQMGTRWAKDTIVNGKSVYALGDRHGADPQYWPKELRIQEFPHV